MSSSSPIALGWRLGLACSLSSLLPAESWAQAAPSSRLDPIQISPPEAAKSKRPSRNNAATAVRSRSRFTTNPAAHDTSQSAVSSASASSTLNATKPEATGSRLNLTPLQTPASVEVISSETIAERGQHNVIDAVTQDAAGFIATPAPGNGGLSFSTRGFAGSNSVMTLYDGTRFYVGSGTLTFPYDTWSTQRIEVLRGPASVLYGEGAIGGVINVIPKKPLATPYNDAEVSLDSNMTRRLAVDSAGPINPSVSYRVNATGNMSDGWVDRDKTSNVAVSAAVRVQVSDNLAFTLSEDYGDRSPSRYFGTPVINGGILDALRFKNYNASDSTIRYRDNWTQFKTEWDVADGIKVNNTLYYLTSERHWRDIENYTWNPATQLIDRSSYIEIFHDQKQLGNRMDTTFSGHIFGFANQFVTGFDVNHIDFTHTNNSPYAGASSVNPYVFDPGSFATTSPTAPGFNAIVNQYALFAEDRLSLTDQLSFVTGVRYDRPEVDRTDYRVPSNSFDVALSGTSWRAGLVYEPIKNLAFYGQYAVGVDPVTNLISLSTTQKTFQLATGKQAEIGVKQSFWDGRGEWTLAAYEIIKTGLTIPDPSNPTGGLALQIGQQSSRGVEGSSGFALNDGWRIDANLAVLRARYDNNSQVVGGKIVSYDGNVPVNVPQQVSNIWLTWDFAPNWSVYGGVQIVGQMYSDLANTQARPGHNVVNGGVRWKPDDRTTVAFRVYNLFDKVYAVTSNGTGQWLLGMPRTAELSLNVKF